MMNTAISILVGILLFCLISISLPYVIDSYLIMSLDYFPICGGGYVFQPGVN